MHYQASHQALSAELKAALHPADLGIAPQDPLKTDLNRLTLVVGCAVAHQSFALDLAASGHHPDRGRDGRHYPSIVQTCITGFASSANNSRTYKNSSSQS
jgi:hypothetical protein